MVMTVRVVFEFEADGEVTLDDLNDAAAKGERALVKSLGSKWYGSEAVRISTLGRDDIKADE